MRSKPRSSILNTAFLLVAALQTCFRGGSSFLLPTHSSVIVGRSTSTLIHSTAPDTNSVDDNININISSMMPATPASDLPPNVQSLIDQAKDLYNKSFVGKEDTTATHLPIHCAAAPGRVNLIGEHTDYTGGFVLPLAIGYNTVCYGRGGIVKTDSDHDNVKKSRIVSSDKAVVEFIASPSLTPLSGADKWANYVQGVILQYLPDLPVGETFVVEIAIAGDVPLGSGLSSSASLEVATAVFLECILNKMAYSSHRKDDGEDAAALASPKEVKMERAVRCQRAENQFCNVPCGIMDQFVSSAGCEGKLLLIDCRSLDYREVSVGNDHTSSSEGGEGEDNMPVLVVTNSNVKHDLCEGEYPVRVKQCKDATDILSRVNSSIKLLRDASMEDIDNAVSSEGLEGVLLSRARHVVSENKRTTETADALEKGDWNSVGQLMNKSHSSMKHDYEVSCDEIDILVNLAQKFDGVYGSRLTGGGFGGCTVTLVKKESSQGLMDYLTEKYKKVTGKECVCFQTSPGDGARAIAL